MAFFVTLPRRSLVTSGVPPHLFSRGFKHRLPLGAGTNGSFFDQ